MPSTCEPAIDCRQDFLYPCSFHSRCTSVRLARWQLCQMIAGAAQPIGDLLKFGIAVMWFAAHSPCLPPGQLSAALARAPSTDVQQLVRSMTWKRPTSFSSSAAGLTVTQLLEETSAGWSLGSRCQSFWQSSRVPRLSRTQDAANNFPPRPPRPPIFLPCERTANGAPPSPPEGKELTRPPREPP
jgi:hypothetical protein